MSEVYEHYEKIKAIGDGAFGRCYLCKREDDSFVVLKKIAFSQDALGKLIWMISIILLLFFYYR